MKKTTAHRVQTGLTPLKNIKNIIAIASGKGGVGKSTVTTNLAMVLSQQGYRVGILDADIYGPSQPRLLGLSGKPEIVDNQFVPFISHGVQVMSIGFLIAPDAPAIWRGPMVTKALIQMLNDSAWDNLDYLLIDLPPGTGDIQLTMSQKIPVAGSVIVTTPQDLSLIDAKKAIMMFEKVNVSILGIVENMSTHVCSQCGYEEAIFGSNGAETLTDQHKVPLLGQIPLLSAIREHSDKGVPVVIAEPDSSSAKDYQKIAMSLIAQLALQKKDYSAKFGSLKIEQ